MHPQFSGPGSRKSFDHLELFRARVIEKEIMSFSCGQLVMIPGVHGVGEQGRGAQRVDGKQVAGGWVARRGCGTEAACSDEEPSNVMRGLTTAAHPQQPNTVNTCSRCCTT